MSVYFDQVRGYWKFDFQANRERHAGAVRDPETGEPLTSPRARRRAIEFAAAEKQRIRANGPAAAVPAAAVTLAMAAADWWNWKGRTLRTAWERKLHLAEALKFLGGATPIAEIEHRLVDYRDHLQAKRVRKAAGFEPDGARRWKVLERTLSPRTVNRFLDALKAVLRRAWLKGHLRALPEVPFLPEADPMPRPIAEDQLAAIFEQAAPHVRLAIALGILAGLRGREALSLAPRHVDFARGVATLPAALTKAGRVESVPLVPAVLAMLRDAREEGRALFAQLARNPAAARRYAARWGIRHADDVPFVLYRHRGTGMPRPVRKIRAAWQAAVDRAGLPPGTVFHHTRHTFGTTLAEGGANERILRALLRHSSAAASAHYVRIAEGRQAAALGALAGLEAIMAKASTPNPKSQPRQKRRNAAKPAARQRAKKKEQKQEVRT